MINFDDKILVREECNGISIYNRENDSYVFYEDLTIADVLEKDINQMKQYLYDNSAKISKRIEYRYPFRVNWLIDERCNLDCIYCFAYDKMHTNFLKEDIIGTANHIAALNIMNVGLSGGEPTLNPFLKDAILALKGKCFINLDTNGVLDTYDC